MYYTRKVEKVQEIQRKIAFYIAKGYSYSRIGKIVNLSYKQVLSRAKKIFSLIDDDLLFKKDKTGFICFINSFIIYDYQKTDRYLYKVICYFV